MTGFVQMGHICRTTAGKTSTFDVVERGFPIVLVSRNKTAFSY